MAPELGAGTGARGWPRARRQRLRGYLVLQDSSRELPVLGLPGSRSAAPSCPSACPGHGSAAEAAAPQAELPATPSCPVPPRSALPAPRARLESGWSLAGTRTRHCHLPEHDWKVAGAWQEQPHRALPAPREGWESAWSLAGIPAPSIATSPSRTGERLESGRNPRWTLPASRAQSESGWSLAGTPAPRSARNTCTGLCQLPEQDERAAEGLEEHPHPPRPPKPAQDCGSRALTRCAAWRGCPPDTSGGSASPAAARPCNRSLRDAFCCGEDPSPAGEGAGGGCAC